MRALRAALVALTLTPSAGAAPAAPEPAASRYFPLAVGSSWRYRCSVEGRHQFDKTLRLTAAIEHKGIRYLRAELMVGPKGPAVVSFLSVDSQGSVWTSAAPGAPERELIITVAPKVGDRVGDRRVAALEPLKTPAGTLQALRLETFDIDDPKLTAQQRAEWQGRFFAEGVGQVGEADGLGGDCLLARYRPGKRDR